MSDIESFLGEIAHQIRQLPGIKDLRDSLGLNGPQVNLSDSEPEITPEELADQPDSIKNPSGKGVRHDDITRPGGEADRDKEFGELTIPGSVEEKKPGVKVGKDLDGNKITTYTDSTFNQPAIVVIDSKNRTLWKFRYPK